MKQKLLSNTETSQTCQELAIPFHVSVMLGSGLALLAQEEGSNVGELLAEIGLHVDMGETLAAALREIQAFPSYVMGMMEVSDGSGRTEQALSRYYGQQDQMDRHICTALISPFILLLLMLVVILMGLVMAFSSGNSFRAKLLGMWRKSHGVRGISRKLTEARFAHILTMRLNSVLPLAETVDVCAILLHDIPAAANRCRICASHLRKTASRQSPCVRAK